MSHRTPRRAHPAITIAVTIAAAVLAPATPTAAQTVPPIRPLGAIISVTHDSLGAIASIRPLRDGRVLVNDLASQRLLLFDSSLAKARLVLDTSSTATRRYSD
ncbi:MAG TPA: hypothetical protein VMH39_00700, partial [Gemmatimonadaceae bacterium]|nr:hypothetical protein [Gemmatimonadaceae bacterium]